MPGWRSPAFLTCRSGLAPRRSCWSARGRRRSCSTRRRAAQPAISTRRPTCTGRRSTGRRSRPPSCAAACERPRTTPARGSDMADITLKVNGATREGSPEARKTLADFLRDDLDLTGTHVGCEHGVCGACTVIVDGRPVRSCLMLAVQAAGSEVTTIEGLAPDGGLGTLQQAMWDSHSFQCGFCTPGFVMQATAFLAVHPDAGEQQIREALSGNICRCTGYQSIIDGVLLAAERNRER